MGLKAPGILTFTFSVILVVCAAGSKYAQANIPLINSNEFPILMLAWLVLVLGCMMSRLP
ncbi:MAG: hypothetical protein SFW09_23270 [Hyphomicrobiaceae bacterium]|nr:hypothetical protein [Hyphomicrobiaceae bacterium]